MCGHQWGLIEHISAIAVRTSSKRTNVPVVGIRIGLVRALGPCTIRMAVPKKLMLPVDKGHQEVLAVLDDKDFEGQKLSWSTWLDPGLELHMLRGTERAKRAGRKQVRELNTKRILLKEKEKVPSNET